MRDEGQAERLAHLMSTRLQTYDLTLPPVTIRREKLKGLCQGDIIILPLHTPLLQLWQEGRFYAEVTLSLWDRSVIITNKKDKQLLKKVNTKKYETLFCLFGSLRSKETQRGAHLDVATLDMQRVLVQTATRTIAQGRLVWVDGKIAIEIEKVMK